MRSNVRWILSASMVVAACDTAPAVDQAAVTDPLAADSVLLQESDSAFVSGPMHLSVANTGAFFVTDDMNGQVLEFSRTGNFVRKYGKAGAGPGELRGPMATAFIGDSVLVVAAEGRTSLFSRKTGEFVRSVRTELTPSWVDVQGDSVWIIGVDIRRRTSTALWSLADDAVRYSGGLPGSYVQDSELMYMYPFAAGIRQGDWTLVGYSGHNSLFLLDSGGAVIDSLDLPVVRRRGVPTQLVNRFTARTIEDVEFASSISSVIALHQTPSGEYAVLHFDPIMEDGEISGTAFLTILSADFSDACVDAPFPGTGDGRPWYGFRADTLYVLQQRVASTTHAESAVRAYPLDRSRCTEQPLNARAP